MIDNTNRFKRALATGEPQIGLWIALADPYAAEICAGAVIIKGYWTWARRPCWCLWSTRENRPPPSSSRRRAIRPTASGASEPASHARRAGGSSYGCSLISL